MAKFYAHDLGGRFNFTFTSKGTLDAGLKKAAKVGAEEFEISLQDGSDAIGELAGRIGYLSFDDALRLIDLEPEPEDVIAAVFYFVNNGYDLATAAKKAQDGDASFSEQSAEDYAYSLMEDGAIDHETLKQYFDFQRFARDMGINGDVTEFEFNGKTYLQT